MKGKIVLIPFPFTGLTAAKLRPAMVSTFNEEEAIGLVLDELFETGYKLLRVEGSSNDSCF